MVNVEGTFVTFLFIALQRIVYMDDLGISHV